MSHIKQAHFSRSYFTPNLTTTKIKPKSNNNVTLSQTIPMKKQFVTYIPTIDTYRKTTKLALTDDSIQKIHEKLEVDAQAEKEFERRIKTNDLYVNYNRNPLSDLRPLALNANVTQRNIIDQVNNIKLKNSTLEISKRLLTPRTHAKDICMKLDNDRKRQTTRQGLKEKENIVYYQQRSEIKYVKTDFQILDEIVKQPDTQYFERKFRREEKNIFHLISPKNAAKFLTNKETLEKLYFCFDSIVSITQKDSLVSRPLEELSVFSRELARNYITKKTPERLVLGEGDINLNMDKLEFEELMLIASNRLQPHILIRYFHEEEEQTGRKKTMMDEETMVEEAKKEIPIRYPDNTSNRLDDFNPSSHDRAEIEYYTKSVTTAIEKRQTELSQKYQDKLKRLIQMERLSISCTIEDKTILRQFKEQKNEALMMGLESNVDKRLNLNKETERKIRLNKMNKNRTEKVKIDILTQSFKLKKRLEAKGTKRSGSISPTFRERSANK